MELLLPCFWWSVLSTVFIALGACCKDTVQAGRTEIKSVRFLLFVVSHVVIVPVLLLPPWAWAAVSKMLSWKVLQGMRSQLHLSPERSRCGTVQPHLQMLLWPHLFSFLWFLWAKGERLYGTEKLIQQVCHICTDKYIIFKSNAVPCLLFLPGMCINPSVNMKSRNCSMEQMYMNCFPVFFRF